MKKRDKSFKRVSLCVPVVVMMLTPVPLSGFIGLEQPKPFAAKASAAQEYPSGNYTYTVSGGKTTVTDVSVSIYPSAPACLFRKSVPLLVPAVAFRGFYWYNKNMMYKRGEKQYEKGHNCSHSYRFSHRFGILHRCRITHTGAVSRPLFPG